MRCIRLKIVVILFASTLAAHADPVVMRSKARVGLPIPPGVKTLEGGVSPEDLESICGPLDDSQDVELYDGNLGPTFAFVSAEQPSTAQLQWRDDLAAEFSKPGDNPGNVEGVRWCTGTLIAQDLLLTAAHCMRTIEAGNLSGWVTPKRAGKYLTPAELAPYLGVNFNYQLAKDDGHLRTADVYPVTALVEIGDDKPEVHGVSLDYAIVRLGKGAGGALPGASYAVADLDASSDARAAAKILTIVQHPAGNPKKLDAGAIREPRDVLLRYEELDTLSGASGAGIIDDRGHLIGVHTNGGCTPFGGFNYGVSLNAIADVSGVIK